MLTRIAWACLPAALALSLGACGSKGDLVLPRAAATAPAPAASPAPTPPAAPVPGKQP